jgi:hypothetical protein
MALISCPECGATISDKAAKCPKCGFPMHKDEQCGNSAYTPSKPKSKNKIILLICVLAILIIGAITVVRFIPQTVSASSISIKEISISKWRLTDDLIYGSYYEGTVSTNETDPFVAVIGYYESNTDRPFLVYVNKGNGILQTYESTDEDPSVKYRAIGYMAGRVISETDISDISCRDSDYSDYESLEETSCTVEIEVQFKRKLNGLLFFTLSNDLSNEIDYNCFAVVTNGKLDYSYYVSNLPYKSRGIDVSFVPLYFCKSNGLTEDNYTIEQAFSMVTDMKTYDYYDDYNGSETLRFNDYRNGFVTYIETLTNGGDKVERNVPKRKFAYLVDNECTITTNDFIDKDDDFSTPFYDITILGYISFEELSQQGVH